jgi:ubiquinone biosynthesis protein COQ4
MQPQPNQPTIQDLEIADVTKLSPVERWRRAVTALAHILTNPEATDQVLVFSTYINAGTMARRIERFYANPAARKLFDEHRTIDTSTVDLDALAALPEGTLGRAYADFLRSRGLSPDVFKGAPKAVPDERMAYVIQRLRQTHDLWHVVTGYDTDAASEVALQAFTFAQIGAPSSAMIAILGTVRGVRHKPSLPRDVARGFRRGRRADHLAVFPWEDHWATPLAEVRALLHVAA